MNHGVRLDFGHVKNPNKNPVAEKCNQELEMELLRIDPSGRPVTLSTLQRAVHVLNRRIRNRGSSAREILFCRDQNTGQPLTVNDASLTTMQKGIRQCNHLPSARSKGQKEVAEIMPPLRVGNLVYLKSEDDNFQGRSK